MTVPTAAAPSGPAILLKLWSRRVRILAWVFGASAVSAGLSLLIPNKYTAAVSIMPDKQAQFSAGALAQVAANFGVNLGATSQGLTDLYPAMITSERILGPLLTRTFPTRTAGAGRTPLQIFKLDDEDSAKAFDLGMKKLREQVVGVSQDRRTGLAAMSVTLKDPVMAAAVANAIATDLDRYVRDFQQVQAHDQVTWIQTRLDQVLADLRHSEVALRDFRRTNRSIMTSPDLQLQQARLERDVETNSTVYIEIRRQLELAKVDEVKNIPVVKILDHARVPWKKSAPQRSVIVLGTMLLVLLAAIGLTLIELRLEHDTTGEGARALARVRDDAAALWRRGRARNSR